MGIDVETVRRMADPRSLERGREYARSGAVSRIRQLADGVRATVFGSDEYTVELRSGSDAELAFRCTCPVGASGAFCKHCVAVAVVASESAHSESADPRAYLEGLGREELIEMIVDAAERDEVLYTRLAVASVPTDSAHDLRQVIEAAIVPSGYVHYREAYGYTQGIDLVIDRLDGLLGGGHPQLVLELSEYAIGCAERAVEFVDDSDGMLGSIAERLGELHLAACEAVRPDPVQLAAALYQRELADGQLETFYGAAARYADVLGEPGLTAYRELAERDWAALPTPSRTAGYYGKRDRIGHILETLAELSGDVDAQVEAMSRDLSSAYQYVRIAERYLREDRHDDALRWAEQGIQEFGITDALLVEVAAEQYHHAGCAPAAVQLLWEVMDATPTLRNYERLAEHARRDGSWPKWRDWALDRVRDEIARREPPKYRWQPSADATLLVEIFLWENDPEQAWAEAQRAAAQDRFRCGWPARARTSDRPR